MLVSGEFNGVGRRFRANVSAERVLLHDGDRRTALQRVDAFAFEKSAQRGSDRVAAPMPGRIVVVRAKAGDEVAAGQELLVMEAMKMEIALKAPHAGVIDSVQRDRRRFRRGRHRPGQIRPCDLTDSPRSPSPLASLCGCTETRFESPLGDNIETCDTRWKGLWTVDKIDRRTTPAHSGSTTNAVSPCSTSPSAARRSSRFTCR